MTEQRETNNGWFARWRAQRRSEREQALEREDVAQEELARFLREYPLGADQMPQARTRRRSPEISSGGFWHGGGFWGGGGDGGGCWGGDGGGFGGGDGGGGC